MKPMECLHIEKIKECKTQKELLDYLKKNARILFWHAEVKKERNIYGLEILKKKKDPIWGTLDPNRYYYQYLLNIGLAPPKKAFRANAYCPDCMQAFVYDKERALPICESCGRSETVLENETKETRKSLSMILLFHAHAHQISTN